MRISLKEVQHLYEGMRLYTDGVMMQQVSHPCERNKRPRLGQLLARPLWKALHQQVDKANSLLNLGDPPCLILAYELFQ